MNKFVNSAHDHHSQENAHKVSLTINVFDEDHETNTGKIKGQLKITHSQPDTEN